MSNKIVKINDARESSFRIKITTISEITWVIDTVRGIKETLQRGGWMGGSVTGEWKILDEGFIRARRGKTRTRFSSNGDLTTSDLLILGIQGVKTYDKKDSFGIQLFEYEDIFGVNSKGEGTIIQSWVVGVVPGRISWQIVG